MEVFDMPDNKRAIQPPNDPGAIRDMALRLQLIWRLLLDKRVNILLKVLPVSALAYLIWPLDAVPGVTLPVVGALDDAAILWLGATLFVELCPPDVVEEHKRALGLLPPQPPDEREIIDGEVHDIDE